LHYDFNSLGPVPTTANSHLLVDFPPLFVGISLLAFGKPRQYLLNRRKIAAKAGYCR